MIKNKLFRSKLLFVFSACSFFITIGISLTSNFNFINEADYLTNAVHIGQKNANTGLFDFAMEYKNSNRNWFKNNYNAVSGISSLNSMDSSYMSYELNKPMDISIGGGDGCVDNCEQIGIFGITNACESFVPLNLKIIFGDYVSAKYDCMIPNQQNIYSAIISESMANYISNTCFHISIDQLIGGNVIIDNDVQLTIDCIVRDDCLLTDNLQKCLFIASNYLAFSGHLENESFVFKLKDKENDNYTLFNKIFIVGHFPKFFGDDATLNLVFYDNDWIDSELEIVLSKKETNISYLTFFLVGGFCVLGILSNKFEILRNESNKYSTIKSVYAILVFFLSFEISQLMLNGIILFGIHINTKLSFSGIIELFSLFLYILGYLAYGLFRKEIVGYNRKDSEINAECLEINI